MPRGFEIRWQQLLERRFDGDDFADLLLSIYRVLPPGTLAAELGRTMANERVEKRELAIPLDDITELRKTTRIDGIMPFVVPSVNDLNHLAGSLLDQAEVLGLDVPSRSQWQPLRDEIGLCYLALFHRRKLRIEARFELDLQVECPYSGSAPRKKEMLLMGHLPLGGRMVVFSTPLKAEHWAESIHSSSIEHIKKLAAQRNSDGELRLVEAESYRPDADESS